MVMRPHYISSPLLRYAIALGLVAMAFGIRYALTPVLGHHTSLCLFIPAAMLAAWYGGSGPGLVALIVGLLLGDLFFLSPKVGTVHFGIAELVMLPIYFITGIIGILTIEFLHRMQRQVGLSKEQQQLLKQEMAARQRAEDTIRQSEAQYRLLFESNPLPMMVYDQKTLKFLALNEAAIQHYGYAREEFLNLTIRDIRPPEDWPALERFLRTQPHGLRGPRVWRHCKKDGSLIEVEITSNDLPFVGRDARLVLANDVTERKRAETALRESEARFRLMADTAPVGIWVSGTDGRCIYFNRPWLDFTGRTLEQELGECWAEGVHLEDLQRCLSTYQQSFEARRPFAMEYRLRRSDGEYRWILDHGVPRFNPDAEFAGYIGSCIDITDRKRAEAALVASENLTRRHLAELQAIYNQAPVGLCFLDKDLRFVRINQRLAELDGPTVAEHLGRTLREVIPKIAAVQEPILRRVLETNTPVENLDVKAAALDDPSRERYGLASYYPIRTPDLCGINVMVIDITERKAAEKALREAQAQLSRYAQDLEQQVAARTADLRESVQSLEGICYHITHDLRAPLRSIYGFSSAVLNLYAPVLDDQGRDLIRRTVEASAYMDQLITDLLAYGRVGHVAVPMSWVKLDLVLDQVLHLLDEEIRRKGARIEVAQPLPELWANPTLLEQILNNLLANALKYVAPNVAPHVQIWAEESENSVCVCVQDNGIGIAPEHQARIFAAFERLHSAEAYPGTGVGLAIVQKAAQRLGGKVHVQSQPGQGSRFSLLVPKPNRSPAQPEPSAAPSPPNR